MSRELTTALEEHLAAALAPAAKRSAASAALVSRATAAVKAGAHDEVASVLRRAALPTLDLSAMQALRRVVSKLVASSPAGGVPAKKLKLAVVGGLTTDQLVQGIELFLYANGIDAEVFNPGYGTFRQEILDPESKLYQFAPSVILIATSRRDLANLPELGDSRERVAECVTSEVAAWARLWQAAHDRLGCQIIQNNFDTPPWRLLANHELAPSALGGYIARLNLALHDSAPPFVTVHDIDGLAASAGRSTWGDPRFFHLAKLPCAPQFLVDYAHSAASLVTSLLGKSRKCLVLDLDNTLWGGVIGDDGLAGIRVGQGDADSEAFSSFQEYARGLRRRGILLAVCSKNTDAVAREAFEKHPGMTLRLDDIACFVANWDDKATNLRAIAAQLNIGLDSLVFVDDNPAERSLVRQFAPEVAVPEIPIDPSGYIEAVEAHRYFQSTALTKEDLQRSDYYRADIARKQSAGTTDLGEFLGSLAMVAQIGPIGPLTLERSVQLINKSNQYNLTTRRYSTADLLATTGDESWITRTVSLTDKFGDNGLISVVMAKVVSDALEIDTWLMSCRVLKRTVEHYLLNHLVALARERGLKTVRGEFIPSAKNGLVVDHYEKLGFTCTRKDPDGGSSWELSTDASWRPLPAFIDTSKADG